MAPPGQQLQTPTPNPAIHDARGYDGRPHLRTVLLVIVAVILVGSALRATAVVTVPLVASILIALAVLPVRDRVRDHVPKHLSWLGTAAAMTLILLVLALFFGSLWVAAQQVLSELPARPGAIVEALRDTGDEAEQGSLAESAATGAATGAEGAALLGERRPRTPDRTAHRASSCRTPRAVFFGCLATDWPARRAAWQPPS